MIENREGEGGGRVGGREKGTLVQNCNRFRKVEDIGRIEVKRHGRTRYKRLKRIAGPKCSCIRSVTKVTSVPQAYSLYM
jgi:hypothetical protein